MVPVNDGTPGSSPVSVVIKTGSQAGKVQPTGITELILPLAVMSPSFTWNQAGGLTTVTVEVAKHWGAPAIIMSALIVVVPNALPVTSVW